MNILFVHDHPFVVKDDIVFTSGALPSSVWESYLLNADDTLTVFARNLLDRKAKTISSRENVCFVFSQYYKSPKDFFTKQPKVKKELTNVMADIDVVIIRLPSLLGLIAETICRKINKPYSVQVVGNAYESFSNYGNLMGKMLARYIHHLTFQAVKKAPYALYVTKEHLQEVYPNDHIVDYASNVETESGNTIVLSNRFGKVESFNHKIFTVGTIGNVEVRYKGYEVLIKVIADLKREGVIVNYRIAGPGSEEYLRELARSYNIEDQLFFEGALTRNQIFEYLSFLDLYIHPSFTEGLPRVVIEAMSYAVPVLASSAGGTSELIESIYLHEPGDSEKLYGDLLKVVEKKFDLKKMALSNWEKAKEYDRSFLMEKRRAFYERFYQESKK